MSVLAWMALALSVATMIMGYISSATRFEAFIGSLQHGLLYTAGHAIFTTAVFTALFYAALALGRWMVG